MGDRGFEPHSGIQVSKKQNVSSPFTRKNIVGSLRNRERVRPQTARARIFNYVSGGQCHLIHFTILKRFSWLRLAYICLRPHSFHFIYACNAGTTAKIKTNIIRIIIWEVHKIQLGILKISKCLAWTINLLESLNCLSLLQIGSVLFSGVIYSLLNIFVVDCCHWMLSLSILIHLNLKKHQENRHTGILICHSTNWQIRLFNIKRVTK